MKPLIHASAVLSAALASSAAFAHIGQHHDLSLLPGLAHLLWEHALPIGVIVLIAGGLLIKRLLRAR